MPVSDKPESQFAQRNVDLFKIIVVEDDEGIGKLIQKKFKSLGFSTELTLSGTGALNVITGDDHEILIIDYRLSDMTGKQLVEKLIDRHGSTPNFLTLTGYEDVKVAAEMMKIGSQEYLIKEPHFLDALPDVIDRVCNYVKNGQELIKARIELQKNLDLLKETGEMARVGGWEIDLKTNKVIWTDSTRKIHEVTDDYVPDLDTALDFFPSGARFKLEKAVKQAIEKGKPYSMELPFITAKGNKRWVLTKGISQMHEGECIRMHGTFQDITWQKQAELEIKKNSAILKRTEMITHVGSWYRDIETGAGTWSGELFRIFKLDSKKGAPSYADHLKMYSPESSKRFDTAVQECLVTGKSFQLDLEGYRGDGTNVSCSLFGFAKKNEKGKVVQLFGSLQDITERKKKEEKLKQLNRKLIASEKSNQELVINLGERVKELKCLYSIASTIDRPGITLDEILQESVNFIPAGWQSPGDTFARITYREKEYKTSPFHETKNSISYELIAADVKQGAVDVYIAEEDSKGNKLAFLKEEEELLFLIAGRLSKVIDRYETTKQLLSNNQQLQALNQQLISGEQQLTAANQQLVANEQQLKAANQQLIANEQQLKAANQQLAANEQQLKAANRQLLASEAKLLKNNETLRKYLDVAAEIVVLLDLEGKISMLNKSGHLILGYNPGELVGKDWFSACLPKEEGKIVKQHLTEMLSNGIEGFDQYENEIVTKSGERKLILWHNTLFKDDEGNYTGTLSSGEDVTEQRKAQQKLAENEKRFRKAQEAGHIGSWEYNLLTQEFWGSDEGKRIYNLDPLNDEFSAEEVMSIVAEKDREKVNQAMVDLVNCHKPYDIIFEIIPKNTSERKIIHSIAELQRDKEGKPHKVTGVLLDVTLQKNLENQLIEAKEKAEEADQLKSAFLANMSHEIRTPMNGILGFTELLKEPDITGEMQLRFIEIIQKSGNRMLDTVNALIDISKIETGQVVVNIENVDVNQEVQALYDFFKTEANQKGLTFILENKLPDQFMAIQTDKQKLNSIISNLIKNALKYTDSGYIKVGVEIKENVLLFYVKDSGIGIRNDRLQAIFNRFVQADIKDVRAFQGSGLGLAIVKAYVEMLNGEVNVESQEGTGSTFYVKIPFKQKDDAVKPATVKNEKPQPVDLSHIKILIAEDDNISLKHLTLLLQKKVGQLYYAATGRQTIEICKNNPGLDLILMDIRMPDGNGYEALKEIRSFNKQVKIIAQTANALTGDREKMLNAGFDGYIAKPISSDYLFELIQKTLNIKSS